jgi:hypothetical protein
MARSTIEHFRALQKARAAGDDEAAQVIAKNMVDDMSTAERAMFGAGSGIANVVQNVGNILGFVEDETVRETRALTQPLRETTAGRVGEFGGELAASLVPAGGAARLLGMAAKAAPILSKAPALARAIGTAATEGAVQGAVTAGPDERGEAAYFGAATGGLFPAVGAAYRAARAGVRPTPAARSLVRQGVELTPGQMNPQGILGQLEEGAEALPVVGPKVREARQGGWQQTQKLVAKSSAPPGFNKAIPDDPNEAVDVLRKGFNEAYSVAEGFPVAPKIMSEGADIPLSTAFRNAVRDRSTLVKDDDVRSVSRFLKNELSAIQGRPLQSEDLLRVRSNIREQLRARDLSSGSERLLINAEKSVTQALESQLPEDAMRALKQVDNQYAKFSVYRRAVAKGGEKEFTPKQLSTAVKEATDAGEYSAGGGLLRSISKPAATVFGETQPKTGRMVATLGALSLGGYAASQDPYGSIAPLAGMGLLYATPAGRRLAMGQTGMQRGLRGLERQARRNIPKAFREAATTGLRRTGSYAVPGLLVDEEEY